MTLDKAIQIVNSRSRNINLQWIVYKFNNECAICSSSYYKRNLNIEILYTTGDINRVWYMARIDDKLIHTII